MSSIRFEAALSLKLVPSRLLLIGLVSGHLLTLLSLLFCDLPVTVVILLVTFILVSLIWNTIRHANPRNRWFIRRLTWTADGRWLLETGTGEQREVRLIGGYRHPRLLILRFAWDWFGRCAVVLPPDAADPDLIRRLRVRLRMLKTEEDEF